MNHDIDDYHGKINRTRNKFILLLIGIITYISGVFVFFLYNQFENKKNIMEDNDKILKNTADYIPQILGKEYIAKMNDSSAFTRDYYYTYVLKLTEYCKMMNMKFLYTLSMKDGKLCFTSSSATDEELRKGSYTGHLDSYDDAPELFYNLYINNRGAYYEYTDRWGKYRSYITPLQSKDNITYLAAADMDITHLYELFSRSTLKNFLMCLFLLILILPLFFLQYGNLKKEIKTINERLYHDILTGLPNRNSLNNYIAGSENPNIFQINIDSLKSINDYYGYSAGDFIIKEMANRILFFLVSDEYSLYKVESDEFAILLDKKITKNEAETLSRFFIESISEKPFLYEENEIHITITIGVALCSNYDKDMMDDEECMKLLVNSDLALKKAVTSKKNFFIFDKTANIEKGFDYNITIIKKLKESIKNDTILPFYQPIMNNFTGKIEKYESLIRIKDNGKILMPVNFLDISKKSKFYHKLTRIIIHKTFEEMKKHDFEFSINISINDIFDDETLIFLKFKLEENRRNNHKVVFELLESEGIENYDDVKEFIDMIKAYKCKIAIDDFGSGYSNFGHLIKLNVDYIKLDSMIIKNMDNDRNNRIIAKNINSFAHELGIKTIGEYVHSKQILDIVKDIGIDYSQGYYIGKPSEIIDT